MRNSLNLNSIWRNFFLVREKNMSLPKPRHSSDSAAICPGQPKYGTPKNNALTRLKSLSDKGMVASRIDIYEPYDMAFPCYEISSFNSNHCKAAIHHQSKFQPVRYWQDSVMAPVLMYIWWKEDQKKAFQEVHGLLNV